MSLSSYRSAPRIGHSERAKRLVGYISKMKEAKLRFHVSLPGYSDLSYVHIIGNNQYMEIPKNP